MIPTLCRNGQSPIQLYTSLSSKSKKYFKALAQPSEGFKMAETAELQNEQIETYGHSLSTILCLGRAATPVERSSFEELAFDDFITAVAEMLKTDPEHRPNLEVNNKRGHVVIGGKTRAADGRPMVDILETGYRKSVELATTNPELKSQARRDGIDIEIATNRVDQLKTGETFWGISYYPKEALEKYPKTYTKLGYKAGLIYVQTYSKVSENTLVAASYSVDMADEAVWRTILAENGMNIPTQASTDEWLLHGQVTELNADEAEALALDLRQQYYHKIGGSTAKKSTTELASANRDLLKSIFDAYYQSLGQALATGTNNDTLKSLAASLLDKGITNFKPEIVEQLQQILISDNFDAESGRAVDSLVRYAATEELRKRIFKTNIAKIPIYSESNIGYDHSYVYGLQAVNSLVANNISVGVAAGRSYGGCPGQIELGKKSVLEKVTFEKADITSPQEAFGGKDANPEQWDWKNGICRTDNCPTRPKRTKVGPCSVCQGCQHLYDQGKDPTHEYKLRRTKAAYN